MGQSTETDTAQAIAKRKVRAVGQVVETDTAQAISTVAGIAVGQVVETDTAQAMRAVKIVFVQQVSEGDLAQSLFPLKYVAVVQVVETDLAQAITVNAGASVILIAPSGAYEVWVNSFEWTGIPNATWYLLQVRTLDDVDLFLQWYLIVDVGQGVGDLDCAVSPAALANLPLGSYKWRILPYTTDYLVWTDYKYFSVINPIVYVAMGQAFETDKAFAMRYEYSHKVGLKIPERRRSTLSDGEPLEGMAPKRKPRRLYK